MIFEATLRKLVCLFLVLMNNKQVDQPFKAMTKFEIHVPLSSSPPSSSSSSSSSPSSFSEVSFESLSPRISVKNPQDLVEGFPNLSNATVMMEMVDIRPTKWLNEDMNFWMANRLLKSAKESHSVVRQGQYRWILPTEFSCPTKVAIFPQLFSDSNH